MRSGTIWLDWMDAQLVDMRERQIAFYDIALEMGLSTSTVVRRARQLNLSTKAFSRRGKHNCGRNHDNLIKGK